MGVETKIQKPIRGLASFGKSYGIPIVAGVSGFAGGDVFQLRTMIDARMPARTVTVVGFEFDISAWLTIFIYASLAVVSGSLVGKLNGAAGRAAFAFFMGVVLNQLVKVFKIVQDFVTVA